MGLSLVVIAVAIVALVLLYRWPPTLALEREATIPAETSLEPGIAQLSAFWWP